MKLILNTLASAIRTHQLSQVMAGSAVTALLAAAALPAAANEFVLEEVIVTAQKRTESLQDVPISVSAMGGEKLNDAGIENLQDLSAYVPNLKVVEGGFVPQMYIRGIGSGANQGFEQSVGTYSDGVYMGRSLQSRSSFMDLERVEVLRGPQSILFGKNSIAGAISLVSAAPTDDFEAEVGASFAPEYDETELTAYVSGPLTDKLKARLAVRDRQEDGYVENKTLGTDAPAIDEQAARLTLAWEASEKLDVTLKLESAQVDRKGRQTEVMDLGAYPLIAAPFQDDGTANGVTWSNEDNSMSFDSESALLKLDYALGESTLTSISSYSTYDYQEDNYDPDNTAVQVVSIDMSEDFEQFSQEIRLVSPGGETVDYILGAFYQTSEQEYFEHSDLYVTNVGLALPTGIAVERPFEQESDMWAVFAQATWNLNEFLRLTAGVRYTEEDKKASRSQRAYNIDAFGPGGFFAEGTLLSTTPLAATLQNGFRMIDHDLNGQRDEEILTPSLSLQYDIDTDVMLYASYSTGFKSGGFDARGINGASATDGLPAAIFTPISLGGDNFMFEEEKAKTMELGAKMTLLDGTAELNAALFQTDYTDMQTSAFDGTFGFNVLNAGAATVRGLELDGRWRATENLMFTGALSYLDFEWSDYDEAPCPGMGEQVASSSGTNCRFDGRENIQTPEWTFNLGANHTYPVGESLELRTSIDANFKDNHYTANNLDERSEQSAITVINMRIALASGDDRWQVALTGKNLTDREVMNYSTKLTLGSGFGAVPEGGMTTQMARPRTVAIEGRYSF